ADYREADRKLWQKGEELKKTTLHESKSEMQSLIEKNQELEKKLTELKEYEQLLEDQLKESDILREKMENELKAALRELKADYREADRKLWQKGEELKKTTVRLMEMTEDYSKQQNLLHESKSEMQSLIEKNQELEKKLTELKEYEQLTKDQSMNVQGCQLEDQLKESDILREKMENELKAALRELKLHESKSEMQSLIEKNQELEKKLTELKEYEQQSAAGALQELKNEQQKRENAEKILQELETEVKNKDQELTSLLSKVENLHQALKRTENSQQVLMKELENHKQNNQQPGRSLAIEELKTTQLKQDIKITPIGNFFKEWRDCALYCAALENKNQQLETQLAELKERYKQEFRRIIKEEQQWREEIEVEVGNLRMELEKKNELFTVQPEAESEAHEVTASVPTEKEEIAEAEAS
ncbi:hypothetical protein CRENBAI_012709, partial [Crenichthys baileyi]